MTKAADRDSPDLACCSCGQLLASFDAASDTHTPSAEKLFAAGAVPVPNFIGSGFRPGRYSSGRDLRLHENF